MALAPADFYAYSRATGVPVPEDPEERAEMAPEVLEFRRNQLKGPDQGGNLLGAVGAVLAGAGLLGGGLLAGRRLGRQTPQGTPTSPLGVNMADLAQVQETKLRPTTPAPSKVAEPVAAIPQATVDIDQFLKQNERLYRRLVSAEDKKEKQVLGAQYLEDLRSGKTSEFASPLTTSPTRANQPGSFKDLTSIQEDLLNQVRNQQVEAVDTGLDQTIQNIDAISRRDIDNVRTGTFVSAEDTPADPLVAELKVSPNESVVAQLNKRKAARQQALNSARQSLGIDTTDAPLPEGFEVDVTPGEKAGALAQEALREAKKRRQNTGPAPISQGYKDALFNVTERGMLLLKPEIIAKNLGDVNVFPPELSAELRGAIKVSDSIKSLNSNDLSALEISDPSILRRATQHVMQNLLAADDANTVKEYLLSGGELQVPSTKGFGYTGTSSLPTEVVSITNAKGEQKISVSGPRAAARYTRSDLEPLFFDEDTGALIRKSDIGATQSSQGEAGSGIGAEVGQAVGFVPRESVEKFTTSLGINRLDIDEDEFNRYKGQGVGYAVGGVKEFGNTGVIQISPEIWTAIRQKRKELNLKPTETTPEIEAMLNRARFSDADLSIQNLPLFKDADTALESGQILTASNGKPYLRVNNLMLHANPGAEKFVDKNHGTLYKNPATGQEFTSIYDAVNTYNRLANNTNAKLIQPAEMRVKALEQGENLNVQLSRKNNKAVFTQLNPNLVIDQITRRTPKGESVTDDVTLAQAIRNQLLNPYLKDEKGSVLRDPQTKLPVRGMSLIQEKRVINDDGTPGALYYKQARYKTTEDNTYLDTKTGERKPKMLGFGDANLPLASEGEEGVKNNFVFLQGVNDALEDLIGQRIKVIDNAILLGKQPGFEFMGGPTKNPVLREALTIANTLAQTSESQFRVRMTGLEDEGLGERYGLGATKSERPERNVPSRQNTFTLPVQQVTQSQMRDPNTGDLKLVTQLTSTNQSRNVQVPPEVIGGKRLASALLDYRERSGRPMRRQDFLSMAADIAKQEGADVTALINQAAAASRGAGAQAATGRLMSQGRRALSAMDIPSPAEEIAQTIAEYDFGESIGGDIEDAIQTARQPVDIDMELTARQAQRAKTEPPGTSETFTVDDQMLSNMMGKLRAQAGRRAGKRRNR